MLDSIGGTPLIRLTRAAEGLRPRIYVKPEWQNPGGSVKDRAALAMLRQAEADGSLRPDGVVVEVTSGNTGIGLALTAAQLGYRAVIFTSSAIAQEKRDQLAAYGAELRLVDAFVPRSHPDSLRSQGERYVAETPGAWFAQQYDNPANPAAHYTGTGPEIWQDTEGAVTHFIATVGTGGTISGTGRYLKEISGGRVSVIGADPITSRYSGGDGSQKYIEGAGHFVHPETTVDEWPKSLDLGVIDDFVPVEDQDAIDAVRRLARTEGILAGGSSGVALAGALRVAEGLTEQDTVVVLLPDSGRTYLSTYFNDRWLQTNGFTAAGAEAGVEGPTVGAFATAARLVEQDEDVVEALRRLAAENVTDESLKDEGLKDEGLKDENLAEDAPVLVAHRREWRTLAPHPSDILGWTTPARLRGAGTIAETVRPVGPKLGAGLALTDPAVTDWSEADEGDGGDDGGIALVLDRGRVAGTVSRQALRREPAAAAVGQVVR
ncbi:PLP-dependent cysteine synthase family protein [Streptacidiphilus sp. PAMC 29251]